MINLLKKEASVHGDKLEIISLNGLEKIKREIDVFYENTEVNRFQKYIIKKMYKFNTDCDFEVKSVIIVAIPHPAYAKVEFNRNGKKYHLHSLVKSDFNRTDQYLQEFLFKHHYQIKKANNLPLKRLAVQSGLAVYGKNNITYVNGLGSYISYAAYFTDIECENDEIRKVTQGSLCSNCTLCLKECPTKAIKDDRFLIDNEKCLSFFNENTRDFPEWIPDSAHHLLYDCLKCQIHCPMNIDVKNDIETIKFNEEETRMLETESQIDLYPDELKEKVKYLGLDDWIKAIPRNLQVLFELYDKNDNMTL